jgi:hypothetical protein
VEGRESFQKGVKRDSLPGIVAPATGHQTTLVPQLEHHLLSDPRLADPGLTAQEHHAARSLDCRRDRGADLLHFLLTRHQLDLWNRSQVAARGQRIGRTDLARAGATRRRLEDLPGLSVEVEDLGQLPDSIPIWRPAYASLQVADGAGADSSPLRQLFLGEMSQGSVLPQ